MSQSRWFLPVVLLGGLLFGFGLAVSTMTHPEVVLAFLTGADLGLVFVMGGGSVVAGLAFWGLPRLRGSAPLTGDSYGRRLKSFDRNVLIGGSIFGVGWGLSGICPGAAYASLGIGNWPILYGIGGMVIGAYLQGWYRSLGAPAPVRTPADD